MPKIIFLDIDGTLVDYETRVPPSAVRAIRAARSRGHRVYFCTGRSRAEIYPELWDIGVDGMIGGNGSYVEDGGQVLLHQSLSLEQCRHVVDWLYQRGLEFYLESNSGLFGSEHFREAGLPVIQEYSKRKEVANAEQLTVEAVFPEMIFGGDLYRDDVNKISFILSSYQDYLDAAAEFPDLKPGTWGGKGETALFGDLGVKDITKANAIETLLRHLHADIRDTIAFGDAKVDIPMLEYCHIGVAMGNGGPEILQMADYVTAGVEDDGLYKAFVHLGLIEE
ncbi:MAG: HAD family hydrolase [Clostridiales bacterium]|nr:HAD family hydrolase [Clostridiales bacterium]